MMVANDFIHDTRVYKEARSLITWGCDVHVLAMARPDLPAKEEKDGIAIHRLAMPPRRMIRLFLLPFVWWNRSCTRRVF